MKSKCEYCESYIQQHIINFPLNTEASYDILHNGSHSRRWAWSRYLTPNCFWWAAANQRTSETPQYHKSLASVSFLPRWVIVMVARHRDPLRRQHPRGRNATSIQNVLFTHWETISNVFRGVFRCSFRPFSSVSMARNLWNLLNLNESESESSAWAPIQNCRAFCSFRNEGWLNYTNPSPGDFTVLLLLGSRSPQKKLRRGNESRRLTHRSQENVVEGWCREREREREAHLSRPRALAHDDLLIRGYFRRVVVHVQHLDGDGHVAEEAGAVCGGEREREGRETEEMNVKSFDSRASTLRFQTHCVLFLFGPLWVFLVFGWNFFVSRRPSDRLHATKWPASLLFGIKAAAQATNSPEHADAVSI